MHTAEVSASYSRRSKDLDHAGLNVASQQTDNINRAKQQGNTISADHLFVDNDISASRFTKKVRTDWLKLRHEIEHGPVVNIYTLMLDRLLRLPGELEWLIDQAFIGNFHSIITDEDVLDLRTESGISRARGMAHAADMEVRKMSKRIRRAFDQKRARGESHNGVIKLGWLGTRHGHDNDNGDTIHDGEAALIRDAASRHLRGVSYNTIAAEWTNAGLVHPKEMHRARKEDRTPVVKAWTATEVKYAVTSERNNGWMVHDGERVAKCFPVIIPDATFTKLVAVTERRKHGPRSTRHTGMWTGFVRCGGFMEDGSPCGAPMLFNPNGDPSKVQFNCRALPGRRACGKNGIMAVHVINATHEWLPTFVNADADIRRGVIREDNTIDAMTDELRVLKQRIDEANEDRALGRLTRAEANKIVDTIHARQAEITRNLSATGSKESLAQWFGDGDALMAWMTGPACTASEHRAVLLATERFAWITPRPTARPSKAVDSSARVVIRADHPATRARRKRTA